jgi:Spy/CpxP family protein refolding chaperone
MKGIRSFAIGTVWMFALTIVAQQVVTSSGVPTAESQLKLFTAKLDLTTSQQAKIRPILQELQTGTENIVKEGNLSHDSILEKVGPLRLNADKKIREVLNDQQKKQLDQLEHEPHPELHGGLN